MPAVYVCFHCKREIPASYVKREARCPYCNTSILFKKRPNIVKKIKAR